MYRIFGKKTRAHSGPVPYVSLWDRRETWWNVAVIERFQDSDVSKLDSASRMDASMRYRSLLLLLLTMAQLMDCQLTSRVDSKESRSGADCREDLLLDVKMAINRLSTSMQQTSEYGNSWYDNKMKRKPSGQAQHGITTSTSVYRWFNGVYSVVCTVCIQKLWN